MNDEFVHKNLSFDALALAIYGVILRARGIIDFLVEKTLAHKQSKKEVGGVSTYDRTGLCINHRQKTRLFLKNHVLPQLK